MFRILTIAATMLMLLSQAHAGRARILKGQARDIATFKRRIQKSALHPEAKKKILKKIDGARQAVLDSKSGYQRVHTDVTRYGATLVFSHAWGRQVTIRVTGTSAKSNNVEIFTYHKKSKTAYRARAISDSLTTIYRGRTLADYSEKESFGIHTTARQRPTKLTARLWKALYYGPRDRALAPQVDKLLADSAPAKLDLRGKKVRESKR